jgi:hypothetical protein
VVIGVVARPGVIGSADRAAAGALPAGKPKNRTEKITEEAAAVWRPLLFSNEA